MLVQAHSPVVPNAVLLDKGRNVLLPGGWQPVTIDEPHVFHKVAMQMLLSHHCHQSCFSCTLQLMTPVHELSREVLLWCVRCITVPACTTHKQAVFAVMYTVMYMHVAASPIAHWRHAFAQSLPGSSQVTALWTGPERIMQLVSGKSMPSGPDL